MCPKTKVLDVSQPAKHPDHSEGAELTLEVVGETVDLAKGGDISRMT